jgi:sialate O-acetylesterase
VNWLVYILLSAWVLMPGTGQAKVRLPALVSNGMILQRGQQITIWGWAKPGERITVIFEHHSYSTITGATGKWKAGLPAHRAGGPYDLTIQGENSIIIRDILFGDVWLCAGQSNMEYRLQRSQARYARDIAQADNPRIRQFLVKTAWSYDSKDDVAPTAWKNATPANVLNFSRLFFC